MTSYVAGLIRLSLNIVLFIFSSDPEFDETEPYNRALMFYVDNLSMGNTEHANSLNPNLQQMSKKILTPYIYSCDATKFLTTQIDATTCHGTE